MGRSILASSDPSDLESSQEFGKILFGAFKRTENTNYLNESIHILRQLLARLLPKPLRVNTILSHMQSLYTRSKISQGHRRMQDQQEMVELIPQFLDDGSHLLSLHDRINFGCIWPLLARATQHPSTPIAYDTALSFMQDIASFSPTLHLQHTTLTTLHTHPDVLPLDYASYQVEQGQLKEAIETLEQGRALLWSEVRHLRASVDQLLYVARN